MFISAKVNMNDILTLQIMYLCIYISNIKVNLQAAYI